jgi:hypothetical protein
MEELLPYYERELSHLRHYSGGFAQRYPKIAGYLLPADEHSDDPYIEQLIQAIAVLDARIGKKLKDDYLQCVEALLDVMQPHYLRPFPACSIAQFSVAAATGDKPNTYRLARGTELVSPAMIGWRASVGGGEDNSPTPDSRLFPADSAGFYWSKMEMAQYADRDIVLQRRVVAATKPPQHHHPDPSPAVQKIYYHSDNFHDASAAVNYPAGVGNPNSTFNGYVAAASDSLKRWR